ncbi:unknown [Prevotella sp. CAG:1058]|nr:unknown [Prevotella sp. CAG:1058]
MFYVLIISLALFYVGYSLYIIKKNKKSKGVKRSLIMVGEELFLPLPFFFVVSILFDILPSVAYPFAAVVSLAVIFVVRYIRGRYHDADIYLFTFFGFCLLGMLENNFGLSLGVAVAVSLFALLLIILLYFYMLYFID